MERTFHMLLYRAFHAQRSYLRPCLGEIGLVVGQPKLITYLAVSYTHLDVYKRQALDQVQAKMTEG